jgi:diketogulonate reductase-like aldo/keto reductase
MSSSRLSFGTYNLFSPNLEVALQSAIDNGFRNIDTAQLYHNSSKIGPMITTEFHVTTKIFKHIASDMTVSLCKKSLMYFDGIPATILLHNPAPSASWIGLEQFAAQNPAVKIGVSNHNQHDLEVLARYASVMPVINQIEFNPYVDNTALLVYCRDNNIAVEAHTIFGKGLCLSDPIIMELAEAAQMSSAQLLLQWCLDKEIHVVISTKNAEHLRELIDTYQMNRALSVDITTKLDNIHKTISHRFYNKPIYFIPEITISTNEEIVQYCDMMSAALTNDLAIIKELGDNPPLQKFYNIPISYMVDYAPKNNKAHRELRTLLEKKMNMDSVSYYKTIQKIDEHLIAQKHAADIAKKEKLQNKTCSLSRRPQSDKISNAC